MLKSTLVSPSAHPRELIKSREYRNSIIEKVERIFNQLANPNPSTVTLLQQEANRVKDELIWIIDLNLKHLSREFCTPSTISKTEKSRYDYNDISQFHRQFPLFYDADWAPSSSLFSTCYDTHSTNSKRTISKINTESTTLNSASLTTHHHHHHNNRSSSSSSNATTTTSTTKNNGEATTTSTNATPSTTSSNSSLHSNHHLPPQQQQQHNSKESNNNNTKNNFSHSSADLQHHHYQHYPHRHYYSNSPPRGGGNNNAAGLHSLHLAPSHKNKSSALTIGENNSTSLIATALNSDKFSPHQHHHSRSGLHPSTTADDIPTTTGGGAPSLLQSRHHHSIHTHSQHHSRHHHHLNHNHHHHNSHSPSEQHSLTQDQALQQPISTDPFSQNKPSNTNSNSYHSKITTEPTLSSVPFSQISKPPTSMNNQTLSQSRPPCSKQSRAPTSLAQSFENLSLAVGSGNQDTYSNVHHENSILHHLLPSEQDYGLPELASHSTQQQRHHHQHHDSSLPPSHQQQHQQPSSSSSSSLVGGSLINNNNHHHHHINQNNSIIAAATHHQENDINGNINATKINKMTTINNNTHKSSNHHHQTNNPMLIGSERNSQNKIMKNASNGISNMNDNDSKSIKNNNAVVIKPPKNNIISSTKNTNNSSSSPFSFGYASNSSHVTQQQQQHKSHHVIHLQHNKNNTSNSNSNSNQNHPSSSVPNRNKKQHNVDQVQPPPPPLPPPPASQQQQQPVRPPSSSSLKNSNSQPFRQHPAPCKTIGDQFTQLMFLQNEHVPHQAPHLANKTTNTSKSRYDDENKNVSWLKVAKEPNLNNSPHDPYRPSHKSSRTNFASKPKQNAIVHNYPSNIKKNTKRTSDKTNLPRKPPSEDQLRRRIFISNLPSDFTEGAIRSELESTCGPIAHTLWFASRTDGKFYGSGLITFSTPNGAGKALTLNGTTMFGRTIRIEPSRCPDPVKKKPPGCQTIYLNNLSKNITDIQLRQIFQSCGDMKSIRVLDRPNKNTNVAFIEFVESDSTTVALEHHGKVIDGYPLHVDYQRNK